MCLIKGREKDVCVHSWCKMAAKHPQYFALFRSDYIMQREGLQSFKIHSTHIGSKPYILPVNPYERGTQERNNFEAFRQAEQAFTEVIGDWPLDRDTFGKSEIEFVLVEEKVLVPADGIWNGSAPLVETVDLREVAVFIGEGSTYIANDFEQFSNIYDDNVVGGEQESIELENAISKAGIPLFKSRRLNPLDMINEGKSPKTTPSRRMQLLEAFKTGMETMRKFSLPAYRIMFIESFCPLSIDVWID